MGQKTPVSAFYYPGRVFYLKKSYTSVCPPKNIMHMHNMQVRKNISQKNAQTSSKSNGPSFSKQCSKQTQRESKP